MRELTELEIKVLLQCLVQGYKWAAFNGHHVRVLDTEEEPTLKGSMYRVEFDYYTVFGKTLHVPGRFENVGWHILDLETIEYQTSLF